MSNLRDRRKALGFSQEALAQELERRGVKIQRTTIAHYEKGLHYPSIPVLRVMAQILATTTDALLEDIPVEEATSAD